MVRDSFKTEHLCHLMFCTMTLFLTNCSTQDADQSIVTDISANTHKENASADALGNLISPQMFLKNMGEDYRMGVVSLNLDGRQCSMGARGKSCPAGAQHFRDALNDYQDQYSIPWDIVGVQELDTKKDPNNPDWHTETAEFREILSSVFSKSYHCVEQQEYSNDFYAAICSHYPIIEGSYMESVIYHWESGVNKQNRVMQCVQLSAPAGIITACNTHTRAGSNEPRQFFQGFNFIEGTYLPSRVPGNVHSDSRGDYIRGLRASLVITGDMNTNVRNITGNGRMKSSCDCDIDQVMTVDMEHYYQESAPPFLEDYLVVKERGARRYASLGWPTDHQSPSIQPFAINKDLVVNIRYEGQGNGESEEPVPEYPNPPPPDPTPILYSAQAWIAGDSPERIDFYIPGQRLCGDAVTNQNLFDNIEVFSTTKNESLGLIKTFVDQDLLCWQGIWGASPGAVDIDGTVVRILGSREFFQAELDDIITLRIVGLTNFTSSLDFQLGESVVIPPSPLQPSFPQNPVEKPQICSAKQGETFYKTCESWNFDTKHCLAKTNIPESQVDSVQISVSKRLSGTECKTDKNYFSEKQCAHGVCTLSIIVKDGCRAKFRIELGCQETITSTADDAHKSLDPSFSNSKPTPEPLPPAPNVPPPPGPIAPM